MTDKMMQQLAAENQALRRRVAELEGNCRTHAELEERLRQRDAELADSEQRFQQIAANIREVFWLGGAGRGQGQNLYVSPAYAEIWGRPASSLSESPCAWLDAVHQEDRQAVEEAASQLEELGKYDIEYRIQRPDGTTRWIRDRAFPIANEQGQIVRVAGIAEDITQRKLAESQLKSEQQLLRQFIRLQEQERQKVALDLHEGFVQEVVGALLHLQSTQDDADPGTSDPGKIASKVRQASALLQQVIEHCRRVIRDLRPLVLDEEGLIEAIRHLIAEERQRQKLVVAFDHHVRFDRLEAEREGVIFCIVQEALSNVSRHGRTSHAAVQLTESDGALHVVVRDQGIGFEPGNVPPNHFGLRGIREQARLFGGQAEIESAPGQGTVVQVRLPLHSEPTS